MNTDRQIILYELKVEDFIITDKKDPEELHVMEIPQTKKRYYVYLKINDKKYPILIDDYQRDCYATSKKLADFVEKSRHSVFNLLTAFQINIREKDGIEYASFLDGYQRTCAICMILKGIKTIPTYGPFKKWIKKEQDDFLNYGIPCKIYNNLTYEQEVELFKLSNTDVTPVTSKEIRMSQTDKKQEDKIDMLRPSCKQLYAEEKQKAKKNDPILRLLSIYIYINNDIFENIKIDAINEKNNEKIMGLLSQIDDKEYRRKIQPLIKKCNLIALLMSNTLEGDIFKNKNKSSKYFNTDTLIFAILKYCKENPGKEDIFEDFEYGPIIRESILNVYTHYEGKTNTNFKVINEYSSYIYKAIFSTIESIEQLED